MDDFEIELHQIIKVLKQGGIILYPTDTIWGIGCDAKNAVAIKKIYELKRREEKKSLIILVNDAGMIHNFVKDPAPKLLSYLNEQQQPTTCIFENAIHLPDILVNEDGTIAIRIVKDPFCKMLIEQFGKPLVSTSANISGEIFPANFAVVSDAIKSGVDYIVQYRRDDLSEKTPSSIIRLNEYGEIVKLR
ncbi:MAG: L-threonylcarbamoyladenylate synthase [Ginsengibacter sp.]